MHLLGLDIFRLLKIGERLEKFLPYLIKYPIFVSTKSKKMGAKETAQIGNLLFDPYLQCNLFCVRQIIGLYDQRYSIECLFKDMKSTSFNIHRTRLKNPEQVFNLLIIAACAFILLTLLAFQYDSDK